MRAGSLWLQSAFLSSASSMPSPEDCVQGRKETADRGARVNSSWLLPAPEERLFHLQEFRELVAIMLIACNQSAT